MTLHEAIVKLLVEKGRPMSTSEIADELNINKWYSKKDESNITAFQIHGRTRNYSNLFNRNGSMVELIDRPFAEVNRKEKRTASKPKEMGASKHIMSDIILERTLLDLSRFKEAGVIDAVVPSYPGLYCIRIKDSSKLPGIFGRELKERGLDIIYIGKASTSLNRRLLSQELRAKGHGTFFRSIGAILGFKPPKGSLVHKKNKRNFKFGKEDEIKVINWINENLLVNWVEFQGNIPEVESELIKKYKPLLNIDGNPYALAALRELRAECVRIANLEI